MVAIAGNTFLIPSIFEYVFSIVPMFAHTFAIFKLLYRARWVDKNDRSKSDPRPFGP